MNSQIATTKTNPSMNLNFLKSQMTGGSITTSEFKPVTDNTIQSSTDFRTIFSVTNNLYIDSVIDIEAPSKVTSISSTTCSILSFSSQFDIGATCSIIQTSPTTIFRISNPFSQSRPELWAMTVDSSDATSGQFTLQINGINNPSSV